LLLGTAGERGEQQDSVIAGVADLQSQSRKWIDPDTFKEKQGNRVFGSLMNQVVDRSRDSKRLLPREPWQTPELAGGTAANWLVFFHFSTCAGTRRISTPIILEPRALVWPWLILVFFLLSSLVYRVTCPWISADR
jgi:hypothetical protein